LSLGRDLLSSLGGIRIVTEEHAAYERRQRRATRVRARDEASQGVEVPAIHLVILQARSPAWVHCGVCT
jgi:hypothetical protein